VPNAGDTQCIAALTASYIPEFMRAYMSDYTSYQHDGFQRFETVVDYDRLKNDVSTGKLRFPDRALPVVDKLLPKLPSTQRYYWIKLGHKFIDHQTHEIYGFGKEVQDHHHKINFPKQGGRGPRLIDIILRRKTSRNGI